MSNDDPALTKLIGTECIARLEAEAEAWLRDRAEREPEMLRAVMQHYEISTTIERVRKQKPEWADLPAQERHLHYLYLSIVIRDYMTNILVRTGISARSINNKGGSSVL